MDDIMFVRKIKQILNSEGVNLSEITHGKLVQVLKNENIELQIYSKHDWNMFKTSNTYARFLSDIDELYCLGYGNKLISLCLSLKYQIFISHQIIQRFLITRGKNRLSYSIREDIFKKSDVSIKGRIFFNKNVGSSYLSFTCANMSNVFKDKRIGITVFFDENYDRIFLERDDRSAKKIIVHSNDLFISLHPIPLELKNYLTSTERTYKSVFVSIHFNSTNIGISKEELINDNHARLLYPALKKLNFVLPAERITNMSRSKGDLVVSRDNKKLVIEITDLGGKISLKNNHNRNHNFRDLLIGKIMRILTINDCSTVFVFNNHIKESVINDDFNKIIQKYNVKIIFTDFKNYWTNDVSEKINILFESP